MKTGVAAFLVTFVFFVVVFAADDPVWIKDGFGTGNDYIQMNDSQKRAYAMGAINGMLLAPLFGAPKEEMQWFESYVVKMTDKQVAAILSKFLADNPGRWHEGLHVLMYAAIKEAHDKSRSIDRK